MKLSKPFFALAAAMTVLASAPAFADHGHYHGGARVGVVIGTPGYWHYPGMYYYPPYPYPYYAYPPVVVSPPEPPTYIEQAPAPQQQAAQPSSDWYYCRKPEGYYPYVKQCPGGWQRVAPQPPQP